MRQLIATMLDNALDIVHGLIGKFRKGRSYHFRAEKTLVVNNVKVIVIMSCPRTHDD